MKNKLVLMILVGLFVMVFKVPVSAATPGSAASVAALNTGFADWKIPDIGMQFIYVAPGSFMMGSNDGRDNEKPAHRVTISKEYFLGKYEVTQREYQEIMGNNPSHFKGTRMPVESVNWNDAVSFCQRLTERERLAGHLPTSYEYRLPTEAEWEFAARGGFASKGYRYSGSDNLDSVAWYGSNSSHITHEVGTKSANELGLFDMSGNVHEWCLDELHLNYSNAPSDGSCWGEVRGYRVYRGGSWKGSAEGCRVAYCSGCKFDFTGNANGGFRVAVAWVSSVNPAQIAPIAMVKQPPAIANPAATQSVTPATPSETSTVNNAASDKQVKRMIAGNFMFSPADLINFEEQLDYIEKTFWIAASLTKTDPFSKDFEKKLFDLVCLSRVIQATLVVKNKSNEGTDLPSGTLRLSKVWQQFAGRGPYYYGQLRCLSRRSYGLYNNSNTSAYMQWIEDTMIANIDSFKSEDESAISAKLSDYYMAMKDLRCSIVDVAKQNIFDENPQLSKPDKSSSISARKATTTTHKKRK